MTDSPFHKPGPWVDDQNRPYRPCAMPNCPARFLHEVNTPDNVGWIALRGGLTGWLCGRHSAPVLTGAHVNGVADHDRTTNACRLTCTCGTDLGPVTITTNGARQQVFLTHLAAVLAEANAAERPFWIDDRRIDRDQHRLNLEHNPEESERRGFATYTGTCPCGDWAVSGDEHWTAEAFDLHMGQVQDQLDAADAAAVVAIDYTALEAAANSGCPSGCGHPGENHSADLGCWHCDCTAGREGTR